MLWHGLLLYRMLIASEPVEFNVTVSEPFDIGLDSIVIVEKRVLNALKTAWTLMHVYWLSYDYTQVKKLNLPMDDLDPLASADFDREVTFMQGIRHPNLLIFYGAGVSAERTGFMVVELMAKGSMRGILKNVGEYPDLSWPLRISFARYIGTGFCSVNACVLQIRIDA